MNCIRCDRELPNLEAGANQPVGGSEFVTLGHYGSTVTDHMDGTKHVVNVCDSCLIDAIAHGACAVVKPAHLRKSATR